MSAGKWEATVKIHLAFKIVPDIKCAGLLLGDRRMDTKCARVAADVGASIWALVCGRWDVMSVIVTS